MFDWLKRERETPSVDWRDAALFASLEQAELEALEGKMVRQELAQGDEVVEEGEPARAVFVLAEGRAAVLKRDEARELEIGVIEPGEIIGELGVIDQLPAAATVRMKEAGAVWALPLDVLRDESTRRALGGGYDRLLRNLGSVVSDHIRSRSEQSLALLKRRAVMGDFVVKVLILLCVYVFFSEGLEQLRGRRPIDTYVVDLPLQILFGIAALRFIRSTDYPLAQFGIGLRHAFGSLLEALIFTPPFLVAVTGAKWLAQRFLDDPPPPLLAQPDLFDRLGEPAVLGPVLIYAFTCVVQEVIVRGALQSSLESWLLGPHRRAQAIVVAALLFAVAHLHVGFVFAALTVVPGLFWGWLFSRRRNLLGVTLSHIAVGGYVFFVMGLPV